MTGDIRSTIYGNVARDFVDDRLADLCEPDDGVQTGPFGSQLHQEDYVAVGTPIITVEHLGENRIIHDGVPRVSDDDKSRLSKYTLRMGDIVFSRVGSVDRRALVRNDEDGWLFSGRCLRVRPDPTKIDSGYLSFFFGLPSFKEHIRAIAVGATMPSLNTQLLSNVVVPHPPSLDEQRAIAHVLGTIDDKIELNRRMNETLEAMARALFKSWFVDFDPVRAKAEGRDPGLPKPLADLFPDSLVDSPLRAIPKGWHALQLGEIASIERETLNPGTFPEEIFDHYSIPAYDEGREPKTEAGERIKSNKFLIPARAVLVSKLNPRFPRVWLPELGAVRRSICSTEFIVLVARSVSRREYLYCLCTSECLFDTFETLVTGTSSSHQRVKPEDLLRMQVVIPSDQAVRKFSDLTAPLLRQVIKRSEESRTLAALRDALLPKLISGEIRVKA